MSVKIYLGLVINQLEGSYQKEIIAGVKQWAESRDVGIIIISGQSLNNSFTENNIYNSIFQINKSKILSGLIVISGSIGSLQDPKETVRYFQLDKEIPTVSLGMQLEDFHYVGGNNSHGIKEAVDHLILEHQCKKIAFLRGPESSDAANERYNAFVDQMNYNQLSVDTQMIFNGDFSYYTNAVTEYVIEKERIPFDAIICANDLMAIGVIKSLKKLGYIPPRDYLIIGFDDIEEARYNTPALTSISQSLYNQAQLSCDLVMSIINGEQVEKYNEYDSTLIIRESCGCSDFSSRLTIESSATDFKGMMNSIYQTLQQSLEFDIRVRRKESIFLQLLNESLEMSMSWENYTNLWHGTLELIKDSVPSHLTENLEDVSYVNDIFVKGFSILLKRNVQRDAVKYNKIQGVLFRFRSVTDRIIPSVPQREFWSVLEGELSILDIDFLYVALNDNIHKTSFSELKPTFLYNKKRIPISNESSYPVENIFPSFLSLEELPKGIIVQPLIKHDNLFGIIAIESGHMESVIYDTITDIISQVFYTYEFYKERKNIEDQLLNDLRDLNNRYNSTSLYLKNNPVIVVETTAELTIKSVSNEIEGETYIGKRLNLCFKEENQSFNSEKLSELNHFDKVDIPKITVKLPNNETTYPILRYAVGKRDRDSGRCMTILWYILDTKLPFGNEILPNREFYEIYNITDREKEILGLLLYGKRSKDISKELYIAESTVKGHIGQIYSKLEVKGRHDLLELIQEYNLSDHGKNYFLLSLINELLN